MIRHGEPAATATNLPRVGTRGRALVVPLAVALPVVLALGVLALQRPAAGQPGGDGPQPGDTVVVATKPLEPFVFVDSTEPDGRGLRGYSIDVWNEIADRLDLGTEWVIDDTVLQILDRTAEGEVDAAIAGISMTAERETLVDFSHPYFDSGLQVAVRPGNDRGTFGVIADVITSWNVLALVLIMVMLTLVVAHVVWWNERRHNDEFPHQYRKGIGEALWWATVSVITGGEAVKDIRGGWSRLFAVGWMVVGLFLLAFVTAQAASALTVNEFQSSIAGLEDLAGREVVTVDGTVAATFLSNVNIEADTVPDIDLALAAVSEGRYEALVYDAPVVAYRINTDYQGRLELAGGSFAPDPYGIALVSGSPLRELVNEELLTMSRDGTLEQLNQKWLGVDR